MENDRTFEWNEAKAAENVVRGRPAFSCAERFDFDTAMIVADDRRDYGEPRWIAIGLVEGRVHVLVFTVREDATRVISLRKANEREMDRYENYVLDQAARP